MADDKQKDPATAVLEAAIEVEIQKKAAETGRVDNAAMNKWLNQHWKTPRECPVCKQQDWGVVPQFAHVSLGLPGPQLRTRTYPCVAIACRICGNTLFFNAVIMGLLAKGEE